MNIIMKIFKIASNIILSLALALAPLAFTLHSFSDAGPFIPLAEAASFVNVAVPSNTNLTSGLQLYYSFDTFGLLSSVSPRLRSSTTLNSPPPPLLRQGYAGQAPPTRAGMGMLV